MAGMKYNLTLPDKGDLIVKLIIILVVALALVMICPLFGANTMAGKWKASNGYTVHIPDGSGSFSLVFESAAGEKIIHPAKWITVSKEFTWTDKQNATHHASIDPGNPDRICDVNSSYPDSPAYWYRIKN